MSRFPRSCASWRASLRPIRLSISLFSISLFETFGEDKLIFGSDWPNGAAADNLPVIVQIVRDYFQAKGRTASEKYFWKNSLVAYKWTRRDASQPRPG